MKCNCIGQALCFPCDDKFCPSHKRPNKQYLLMQLEENEESIEPHTDPLDEPENFCFPVSV